MKNKDRTYPTPIGELASVTTILGVLNKPFLIPWVKKEAREATIEAVWEFIQRTGDEDFSYEALKSIVTESVKEHERKAQQALDLGSFVHDVTDYQFKSRASIDDCIKQTAEKLQITLSPKDEETARTMIDTYFRALKENDVEVIASEQMVWMKLYPAGFAGTLDRVLRVKGELGIGDLKTNKKHNKGKWQVPLEIRMQVEAYRQAYIEGLKRNTPDWDEVTGFLPIEIVPLKRFVLRLDKETPAVYDFVDLDAEKDMRIEDWKGFCCCCDLYYMLNKKNKEVG